MRKEAKAEGEKPNTLAEGSIVGVAVGVVVGEAEGIALGVALGTQDGYL